MLLYDLLYRQKKKCVSKTAGEGVIQKQKGNIFTHHKDAIYAKWQPGMGSAL